MKNVTMKCGIAAALLLACSAVHADEARSFNSIIRAQASDASESRSADAPPAAEQCASADSSLAAVVFSLLWGSDCGGDVATLSNIDTALQLGPR